MSSEILNNVVYQIATRIGLSVRAKNDNHDGNLTCEFFPNDGHPNESFSVFFRLGWRSASAKVNWGQFSGALLIQMSKAPHESKEAFCAFVHALNSKKIKVTLQINGSDVDPGGPLSWPEKWSKFELSLRTMPLETDPSNNELNERLLLELVIPLFGMMAALIGFEGSDHEFVGVAEGNEKEYQSTRYERKRVNREACVQLKGTSCLVCGLDFLDKYGTLGRGYIEIHHLNPLSTQKQGYVLSIQNDLVPLCSNCHSMAHRESPPVTIEKLREIIKTRNEAEKALLKKHGS